MRANKYFIVALLLTACLSASFAAEGKLTFRKIKAPGGKELEKIRALRLLDKNKCISLALVGKQFDTTLFVTTVNKKGKAKTTVNLGLQDYLGAAWTGELNSLGTKRSAEVTGGLFFLQTVKLKDPNAAFPEVTRVEIYSVGLDANGKALGNAVRVAAIDAPAGRTLSTAGQFMCTGGLESVTIAFTVEIKKSLSPGIWTIERTDFYILEINADGTPVGGKKLIKYTWSAGYNDLLVHKPFWNGFSWLFPISVTAFEKSKVRIYVITLPSRAKSPDLYSAIKKKVIFEHQTTIDVNQYYKITADSVQFLPLEEGSGNRKGAKAGDTTMLIEVHYRRPAYGITRVTRYLQAVKKRGTRKGKPVEVEYPAEWKTFENFLNDGYDFAFHDSLTSNSIRMENGKILVALARGLGVYLTASAEDVASATDFHQIDLLAIDPKTGGVDTLATAKPELGGSRYAPPLLIKNAGEAWIVQQYLDLSIGALFSRFRLQ